MGRNTSYDRYNEMDINTNVAYKKNQRRNNQYIVHEEAVDDTNPLYVSIDGGIIYESITCTQQSSNIEITFEQTKDSYVHHTITGRIPALQHSYVNIHHNRPPPSSCDDVEKSLQKELTQYDHEKLKHLNNQKTISKLPKQTLHTYVNLQIPDTLGKERATIQKKLSCEHVRLNDRRKIRRSHSYANILLHDATLSVHDKHKWCSLDQLKSNDIDNIMPFKMYKQDDDKWGVNLYSLV